MNTTRIQLKMFLKIKFESQLISENVETIKLY